MDGSSLNEAKKIIAKNRADGHPRDRVAMLSTSSGLSQLREAFALIAEGLPLELEVFHNPKDAINWLGLSEHEQQVLQILKDSLS